MFQVATVAAAAAVAAEVPAAAAAKGLVPEQRGPVDRITGQPMVVTSTGASAAGDGALASGQPLSPPSSIGSPSRGGAAAKGKVPSKGPEVTRNPAQVVSRLPDQTFVKPRMLLDLGLPLRLSLECDPYLDSLRCPFPQKTMCFKGRTKG